jgi:hypothetical protein
MKSPITFGSGTLMRYDDEGILGLPSSVPSSEYGSSIMHEAVRQGLLDEPVFTTYMKKCLGSCQDGGQITFGAQDRQHCGPVQGWVNVDPGTSYWQFTADYAQLGNARMTGRIKVITGWGLLFVYKPKVIV